MGQHTPDLEASTSNTQPAIAEKVYDKERLKFLRIDLSQITGEISVRMQFQNYCVNGDASKEDSPSVQKVHFVKDLISEVGNINKLNDTINVMSLVEALTKEIKDYLETR